MKNVYWVLLAVTLLGGGAAIVFYSNNSTFHQEPAPVTTIEETPLGHAVTMEAGSGKLPLRPISGAKKIEDDSTEPDETLVWHSEAGLEFVANWKRDHFGYYSDDDLAEYRSYDRETIEALGQTGDVKAIQVLAEKMLYALEPKTSRFEVYLQAAARGSTFALGRAASAVTSALLLKMFSKVMAMNELPNSILTYWHFTK